MKGSTAAPTQTAQFNSNLVNFNALGCIQLCPPNQSTAIDLLLTDDNEITGGTLLTKGANFGDAANVQVVDKDNVLGYGANTVLNQFVTNWYMSDSISRQADFDLPYPAKIVAGLYLRCIYNNIGTLPVQVAFNYRLHKLKV